MLIGPQRHGAIRKPQPDGTLRLHRPAQGTIVNDVVANGLDAAGCFQRRATRQHAAAGGGGRLVVRVVDRPKRKQHVEEEDKGGDQEMLCMRLARQPRHQRHQHLVLAGARHQLAQIVGGVGDVGVCEPEEFRAHAFFGSLLAALMHGPQLAGPARWPRRAGQHRQARTVQRACKVPRAVVRLVIHQEDAKVAGIILGNQAADAALDDIGLVAGGDHGNHTGPDVGFGDRQSVALAQAPEAAMQQQQIQPDRQRHKAEHDARDHFRYPLSRNQVSASFRPSR